MYKSSVRILGTLHRINNAPLRYYSTPNPEFTGYKTLGLFSVKDRLEVPPPTAEFYSKYNINYEKLCRRIQALSCQLKEGRAFALTDVMDCVCSNTLVVTYYGPKEAPDYDHVEKLNLKFENIRCGAAAASSLFECCPGDAVDMLESKYLEPFEEGRILGCGRVFSKCSLTEGVGDPVAYSRAANQAEVRELSTKPFTPTSFVNLAKKQLGSNATAYNREWIKEQKMESLLTATRGSCEEPWFLDLTYKGKGTGKPVVLLAAPGVTFDCGGTHLKPAEEVHRHVSIGSALILKNLINHFQNPLVNLDITLHAVVPVFENMVSGQSARVGAVVRMLNGDTVQIVDTRLLNLMTLADSLVYGYAKYKPDYIISLGSIYDASCTLGDATYPVWWNNYGFGKSLMQSATITGELSQLCRPLSTAIDPLKSVTGASKLRNKGASASFQDSGAFLRKFICQDQWVHVDVTNVFGHPKSCAAPYYTMHPDLPTGRPFRALAKLLETMATENTEKKKL